MGNREGRDIFVFYLILILISLSLTAALTLAPHYLNLSSESGLYASGAVWNTSNALKTGANLRLEHTDKEGYLTIPIPKGTALEELGVENDYTKHIVRISIPNVPEDFFKEHGFSGDLKNIDTFKYGFEGDSAVIELVSSKFYETRLEVDEDRLYAALIPAHEKYEKIVVIDAAYGGEETGSISYGVMEKDIALNVSRSVWESAVSDEDSADFHIYYTRSDDKEIPEDVREAFMRDTEADLILRLKTNADLSTRVTHGISGYYYEDGMADTAKELIKSVAEGTANKENGVLKRVSGGYSKDMTAREIDLCLGYITNKRDAITASSDKFAALTARAVYGVLKAYIDGTAERADNETE